MSDCVCVCVRSEKIWILWLNIVNPRKKNCNKYSEKKTDWKFFVEHNEQGIMKKKNEQKKK